MSYSYIKSSCVINGNRQNIHTTPFAGLGITINDTTLAVANPLYPYLSVNTALATTTAFSNPHPSVPRDTLLNQSIHAKGMEYRGEERGEYCRHAYRDTPRRREFLKWGEMRGHAPSI
jgi:hypothetical protein